MTGETLARGEARELITRLHWQESLGAKWRAQAFAVFANYCYSEHIKPFERQYSDSALADRMNALGVPCYRGTAPWSEAKIQGIRKGLPRHVAASSGQGRA
jgi:hypothetical protein